jgi:hypothetical protein
VSHIRIGDKVRWPDGEYPLSEYVVADGPYRVEGYDHPAYVVVRYYAYSGYRTPQAKLVGEDKLKLAEWEECPGEHRVVNGVWQRRRSRDVL